MSSENPKYVRVDELIPQVRLEQVAAHYGVALPELKRVSDEVRTRCFLNCGKAEETGDRALAIKVDHPAKQWKCHQYGCPHGGNLISLMDFLAPGPHMDGKPRGNRFKQLAADLLVIATGQSQPEGPVISSAPLTTAPQPASTEERPRNIPLARSPNERARALVDLDRKFVVDPADMNPAAAVYFRQRPFLPPEVCRKWRVGYLPRDSGGDKAGGTMRGMIVYPLRSEAGDILTWFGRDPAFGEKHRHWEAAGKEGREPEKFHFVKGFHRGLELFGQHASRLQEPGYREFLNRHGIICVEGAGDVIALDTLGVPAVGLMSNTATEAQREKLIQWSRQLARGRIVLLLDNDPPGQTGAKELLYQLAAEVDVHLGWTPDSHGGQFRGRQPESLTADEWTQIAATL